MPHSRIFLFDLQQSIVINEHEYAQKLYNVIQWEAYGEISLHLFHGKIFT
jgi:hypothetical protein